jgi:hypothetical protein
VSKARRDREAVPHEQPAPERSPFPSPRLTSVVAVGGVAALVVLGSLTWSEIRQIRLGLDGRLGRIDSQLEKLASRLEPAAPAAARKGPDPNRVYTVRTAGAPTRGPAAAPVTIAEFSDFQ